MPPLPFRLIVMGVSGCGKSTVASALALHLGFEMLDGDDLHLPESIAKMQSGMPLEDADRWPWLDRISGYLNPQDPITQGRVVACSALKRAYRDRIRERAGVVCFLFLNGEFDLIHKRMSQRLGHYMPNGLLDTQFRTLEKPQADEADVITLAITASVEDLVSQSLIVLQSYRVRQLKYSGL